MKKILAITALAAGLALSTQALNAQGMGMGMGYGGCGGGMGYGPGMILNDLNLTDEQADKIYKIDREYREKAWKDRLEYKKAIDKILTADQKKKIEDARKNHRGGMMGYGKGGRHDGMGAGKGEYRGMMGPAIDLTDDQIDKIHRINMDYADKFHKNRNNADELKKLRESRDKDIEKILTKEQLEEFKKFRDDRGFNCPYFPEY